TADLSATLCPHFITLFATARTTGIQKQPKAFVSMNFSIWYVRCLIGAPGGDENVAADDDLDFGNGSSTRRRGQRRDPTTVRCREPCCRVPECARRESAKSPGSKPDFSRKEALSNEGTPGHGAFSEWCGRISSSLGRSCDGFRIRTWQ